MTDGLVPFIRGKNDVKVNLWVTTCDGRNRSMWFKHLSFCKSNPRMLPPPLLCLCSQIMNISCRASDTVPRKIFQVFFSLSETLGLESVTEVWSQSVVPRQRIGFMMHSLMTSGGFFIYFFFFYCWAPLSSVTDKPLSCSRFVSLLKRSVRGVVLSREMIPICSECKLCFWQTVTSFTVWSVWSWND